MPNKQSIPIEIGGKTRYLRYGTNALVAVEEKLNCPLSDIGSKLSGNVGIKDLRILFWAGLMGDDKELTLDGAGDLIDEAVDKGGITFVAEKIAEAFAAAFPEASDAEKKAQQRNLPVKNT